MNKQIQSACHYSSSGDVESAKYKEVETEEAYWTTSASAPEISIYPAEGEEDGSGDIEIDSCTGLPKLPVEPLPPGSPVTTRRLLSSALKMSSTSSPGKRKSVTFGVASNETSNTDGHKVSWIAHSYIWQAMEPGVTLFVTR